MSVSKKGKIRTIRKKSIIVVVYPSTLSIPPVPKTISKDTNKILIIKGVNTPNNKIFIVCNL
jgi:hypothetical protein